MVQRFTPICMFSKMGWGGLCPYRTMWKVHASLLWAWTSRICIFLNLWVADFIFSNTLEDKKASIKLDIFHVKQSWALVISKVALITKLRTALIQFVSWKLLMFPWRNFQFFVCLICDALLCHFNIAGFSLTCLLGECLRNPCVFISAFRRINAGLLLSKIITFYN